MCAFKLTVLFLAVLAGARTALAHDPGLSSAHVRSRETEIEVTLTLSWPDVALLTPAGENVRPIDTEFTALEAELARDQAQLLALHLGEIPTAPATVQVDRAASSPDEAVIVWRWSASGGVPRVFSFPLLSRMPFGHRLMVMDVPGSDPVALLDARHTTWTKPPTAASEQTGLSAPRPSAAVDSPVAAVESRRLGWWPFVPLGVEHILAGFDHLCFLAALLLVTTRGREVVAVVTTFTVAHSLTLAAAALGAVSLPSSVVEPLIAASIVYVGIENLWLRRAPRYRLALIFGFGLVHGLGFASALAERLPGLTGFAVVPPVLAFNAGVELGQLAVAAVLVPLLGWARRREWYARRALPVGSGMIALAGAVWLVQRL